MPVLTNFLSVQELSEEEVALNEKYINTIREYRSAIVHMNQTFGIRIEPKGKFEEFSDILYDKEKDVLIKLLENSGYIPKEFTDCSCFGTEANYTIRLANLMKYPIVSVSQLKQIADALSFVILPIDYTDIEKVFSLYAKADSQDYQYYNRDYYAYSLRSAFCEFRDTIKVCTEMSFINPQTIYILAPLSFYDVWREVSCEEILPKYFPTDLFSLSTTLGLIIPTQRNLYKMTSANTESIREMKKTMDMNFQMLKQSIEECHRRINWVERMVDSLNAKVASMQVKLNEAELKIAQLETMLYCLLDPIIFAVDSKVDISKPVSNNARARIGLCFGPEMPVDFFINNGLTIISDKRFDTVTKILDPKVPIV